MINILYIIFGMDEGGTENQLLELVKNIDSKCFKMHIVSIKGNTTRFIEIPNGAFYEIEYDGLISYKFPRTLMKLRKYCVKENINIIQSFFPSENIIARILASICHIPHVVSVRNLVTGLSSHGTEAQKYIFRLSSLILEKYIFRMSSLLLANSCAVQNRIKDISRLDKKRIRVIFNGIDLNRFKKKTENSLKAARESMGIPLELFVIGIVANYRDVKNHDCFLRALNTIAKRRRDFRAILVGWGPLEKKLQQTIDSFGLRENVVLNGRAEDIVPYLHVFDVGVLTSMFEGFPNAIMEYMATGLPVIASAVGGNCELVMDGKTGFLFPSDDSDSLADRLLFLMENREAAYKMGEYGREIIEKEYTIDIMVKQYEEVYQSLSEVREKHE